MSTDYRWLVALCVAGVGLGLAPSHMAARWRGAVRDLLRPGQSVVQSAAAQVRSLAPERRNEGASSDELGVFKERLAASQRRTRQLEIQVATLEQRMSKAGPADSNAPVGESRPPLYVPQLVEARVLGEISGSLWRSQKLVGAGTASGIVESSLVLHDDRLLVDQGADARVSSGDAVYAGRCVVGKIVEAGRYSSTLQLVTDDGYSGRARLARRTSAGLAFGSEGTLVGTGKPICHLRRIQEPVNVGDEVFTGGTDGILPYAMYYGRVVRAELEPGATAWSIDVEPAAALDRLDVVQVLRLTINSTRLLAD